MLVKPGRPSEAEWAVIRRHPQVGYELLVHIPALPQATLDVVLSHHERWDGTGYPHGLREKEITFGARLFSVIDVYDALTSERPYKAAWTHQAAISELRRLSGQAFDPALVAAFEAVTGGADLNFGDQGCRAVAAREGDPDFHLRGAGLLAFAVSTGERDQRNRQRRNGDGEAQQHQLGDGQDRMW